MSGIIFARTVALRPLQQVRFASRLEQRPDLSLFKEINQLARNGQWDAINNAPPRYKFFNREQSSYTAWNKLEPKTGLFDRFPEGCEVRNIVTLIGLVCFFKLLNIGYNTFVPQEYRWQLKRIQASVSHHLDDGRDGDRGNHGGENH
ncbi:unnamed protein product [Bursaphelenchus okinawaensis]|uniref:Uncharacterized protein n=1 Tax=Bursaphelenchus okinawaensis TaxID=465554 RepID=A0A811LGS9_9BILA|nr:unnamed protein product [Bursaphelenchus okinawaensis]CAG9122116.1 unnamed protein product [Bursaphelenchus okinawaensis]